jgi:Cyclin, N-terminal domain
VHFLITSPFPNCNRAIVELVLYSQHLTIDIVDQIKLELTKKSTHFISQAKFLIQMMIDETQFDVLMGMIQQERTTYRIIKNFTCRPMTVTIGAVCDLLQQGENIECRCIMVDWCYRMIDYCHLNRETVAIAINFVDRFVNSYKGKEYLINNTLYQLVTVTALYTAIKIHEMQSIELQSLTNISNGTYPLEQIEETEREMIKTLKWRMNPPTAISFVRCLLDAVPAHFKLSAQTKEVLLKLSCVQTEYAVFDEELMENKMSIIGYCSLINAFAIVVSDLVVLKQLKHVLAQKLQFQKHDHNEVAQVQPKLYLFLCKHRRYISAFNDNRKNQLMATSHTFDRPSTLSTMPHTKESPRSTAHIS